MDNEEEPIRKNAQGVGTSSVGEQQEAITSEDPTFLLQTEVRKGKSIGDERVRWELPRETPLKRIASGVLEATKVSQAPQSRLDYVKRFLIGSPLTTAQSEQERLTKFKALAVLSSDAISSVAYATESILITVVAAGSGRLWLVLPISGAIVALLAIVAISYRQTIPAYPNGGGSYIVAKDNLGTLPGLIAAASLLIDYVLTVAVSISAGVLSLASLFTVFSPYVVIIDVVLVVLVTVVNLRGVRESGSIFALPTYLFIGSALLMIVVGLVKSFLIQHHPLIAHFAAAPVMEPLGMYLILRSFAAGCSAMTGVEAISNGVPAFKKPEPRNAATTLTWMAVTLGVLFIGISLLATSYGVEANAAGNPTVIAQIAGQIFDGPLYFMNPVFIISVLLILTLAANTSYSDFPRLSSLLARDHFLPHQFAFRGDRLAFSIGIVCLAILASLLLIVFNGNTTNLISLYAVGVFMSFTLSQSGMVRHWWRLRSQHAGWLRSLLINGLGAVTTLLVAVIIAYTKFTSGAWIVVVLIPLLVLMFLAIHRHYLQVERERTTDLPLHYQEIHHRLIVPLRHLSQLTRQCLAYARSTSPHVTAVYVVQDQQIADALQAEWARWQESLSAEEQIHLELIKPTHRMFRRSILQYIDAMHQANPTDTITVILPESSEASLLKRLFTNPQISRLKTDLYFRPEIVVTNISMYQQQSALPLRPRDIEHRFIVPVAGLDRASLQSLAYARSITSRVVAAHVAIDAHEVDALRAEWQRIQKQVLHDDKIQLVVIESPYRSLNRPLLAYIDAINRLHPQETLTVLLPEFVVARPWEFPLHNQTAFQLKTALLARPSIVVTNIPQHIRR